jgi:hypothetical protein
MHPICMRSVPTFSTSARVAKSLRQKSYAIALRTERVPAANRRAGVAYLQLRELQSVRCVCGLPRTTADAKQITIDRPAHGSGSSRPSLSSGEMGRDNIGNDNKSRPISPM